jgi:hypothetical protein
LRPYNNDQDVLRCLSTDLDQEGLPYWEMFSPRVFFFFFFTFYSSLVHCSRKKAQTPLSDELIRAYHAMTDEQDSITGCVYKSQVRSTQVDVLEQEGNLT